MVNRAEIKARAVEARAYAEASVVVLESLGNANEAVQETRRLLRHAEAALDELDALIDMGAGSALSASSPMNSARTLPAKKMRP